MRETINLGTVVMYRRTNADLSNPSELRYLTARDDVELDTEKSWNSPTELEDHWADTVLDIDEALGKYRGSLATIEILGTVMFKILESGNDRLLIVPIFAKSVDGNQLAMLSQKFKAVRFMWGPIYRQMDSKEMWYDATHTFAEKAVCEHDDVVFSIDKAAFESRAYEPLFVHDDY